MPLQHVVLKFRYLRKACDLEARHREDCISRTLVVVIIHSLIMSIRNVFETVHYYSGDGTKDGETMKQLQCWIN